MASLLVLHLWQKYDSELDGYVLRREETGEDDGGGYKELLFIK